MRSLTHTIGLERTLLYCAERGDPRGDGPRLGSDARLVILGADQIDRLAEIGPYEADECADRLSRGDACYSVWIGDDLAHYSWVQQTGVHPIDAADLEVPVGGREIWIYNCRTAEDRRGQGIYPAVLRQILDEHFEDGFERAWIYTSHTNLASQRGIARAGFRSAGILKALRVGRWFHRLTERSR